MPRFRVTVEFSGSDDEEVLEFGDQEKADEHAKDAALKRLSYGAGLIEEDDNGTGQ